MRLKSLTVSGLHGIIDATLDFFQDLTVIVGRNGSGKTSVLDLISNLLRLDIEALRATRFSAATLSLEDPTLKNVTISVSKDAKHGLRKLEIAITGSEPASIVLDVPEETSTGWSSVFSSFGSAT